MSKGYLNHDLSENGCLENDGKFDNNVFAKFSFANSIGLEKYYSTYVQISDSNKMVSIEIRPTKFNVSSEKKILKSNCPVLTKYITGNFYILSRNQIERRVTGE